MSTGPLSTGPLSTGPLFTGPLPPESLSPGSLPPGEYPYGEVPYRQPPHAEAGYRLADYVEAPSRRASYQEAPGGQAPPGEWPFGQTWGFGLMGPPTGELLPTELETGGPDPFASWYSPPRPAPPGTRQAGTGQLAALNGTTAGPPLPPRGQRRGSRPRHAGGTRPRRARGLVIAAGAVAGVTALALVFLTRGSGPSGTTTRMAAPPATASAAGGQSEQRAAGQLASLLAQSGSDRGDVTNAAVNVKDCGQSLAGDQQVFSRAAGNRQALLNKLGSMPGRSALPAQLLTDLTGAWQASAQVDTDLASWAGDQASGCTPAKSMSDPHLQASYAFDSKATADKQAAVSLWNPIAARYRLATYQWQQL